MKVFAGLKSYAAHREKLKEAARIVIDTPEWKHVEDEIRKDMTKLYSKLATCSPKELSIIQCGLTVRNDFFTRLYRLAGFKWAWNGFKTIEDAEFMDDEENLADDYETKIQDEAIRTGSGSAAV